MTSWQRKYYDQKPPRVNRFFGVCGILLCLLCIRTLLRIFLDRYGPTFFFKTNQTIVRTLRAMNTIQWRNPLVKCLIVGAV